MQSYLSVVFLTLCINAHRITVCKTAIFRLFDCIHVGEDKAELVVILYKNRNKQGEIYLKVLQFMHLISVVPFLQKTFLLFQWGNR
jgi:hypothetical protein